MDNLLKIKLTFPNWPIERQTPEHSGVWGNCHFFCNTPVKECDYWVVCEGIEGKKEKAICPKENTILVTCEPPAIKTYKKEFLDQFAIVITTHQNITHPNPIFSQTGLPWHIGRRQKNHVNLKFTKDYDELSAIKEFPEKNKLISVISSSKNDTEGHRSRLSFINSLREQFGSDIDIFGRGINEVEDKWDALYPYQYHIALENSCVTDYWTEKLADPFLAGCHTIYCGCPNIEEYFSPESITVIDINEPVEATQAIKKCIEFSTFEKTKNSIAIERKKILNKYNLFALLCEHINHAEQKNTKTKKYEMITIKKEPSESNILYQLKTKINTLFKS